MNTHNLGSEIKPSEICKWCARSQIILWLIPAHKMKTSKDIYVNTFREEVNCDQCNYFLSLVANPKQHMRFHTGFWMQAMLEEYLLVKTCWTWKKQRNTTPRQQCFGLNDLGRLISMESQWWDETNQMSTVSLWITHTTILAIHYVKVYIFTSAVFWAQWPALVDFREESQLPVVPLHTGSPSANMNCLRVLILPPPTAIQ